MGLCKTLDYRVSDIFTQNLQAPNPKYFIGQGKVKELSEFLMEHDNQEFAIFDCILKANQIFNLENVLKIRVLDRNALILMIFLHHAKTKEAKLQVEYAILKHQIPYVTELVRRTKLGEHPGLMAGGEYQVDEYYRLTKSRIKKIQKELVKIKASRQQQRLNRRRKGLVLVTIAGYTNAGKSALLNVLTNARVLVEERMFSTVSPKTRRFRNSKVLFTDTVGFIQNIPTQLVEAFKSTLEEIIDADHIILIVDISEDINIIKNKILSSCNIIDQLLSEKYSKTKKASKTIKSFNNNPIIKRPQYHLIFNKSDLEVRSYEKAKQILSELSDELTAHGLHSNFIISCKTKAGINGIIKKLYSLDIY